MLCSTPAERFQNEQRCGELGNFADARRGWSHALIGAGRAPRKRS